MIDLHIHTNASDGTYSALEILNKAQQIALKYIAITDHNHMRAYEALKQLDISKHYQGKIIPGIELEFAYKGKMMDMLGYGIDEQKMNQSIPVQKHSKKDIYQEQLQILEQYKKICYTLGLMFKEDLTLETSNQMANDRLFDHISQYPRNQAYLKSHQMVDQTTFYRNGTCQPRSPFYIDKAADACSLEEVCQAIHQSGGVCILAHLFVYGYDYPIRVLDNLIKQNCIDGIEVGHRKHTHNQFQQLKTYCLDHSLLYTSGSDFHIEQNHMGYIHEGSQKILKEHVSEWFYQR